MADRPSFFKIMHSAVVRERKLELPKKFVNKFGQNISDTSVLNVRNGTAWNIELKKVDGAIWFQNGLLDFLEYHSIRAGHFLVFQYDGLLSDGKSQFNVLIFDVRGVEVGHRCICNNCEEQSNGRICREPNGGVGENSANVQSLSPSEAVNSWQSDVAVKDAISFESKNPYFISVMKSSYVNHNFMNMPVDFVRKHLSGGLPNIKLQVPDGRSWEVGCSSYMTQIRISKGWTAFMRGVNLQKGDMCVFELIDAAVDLVMKVHIFPASNKLEKL
ncbi:hypothetical protein Scep_016017 [Stephania cephalantha]|uniref:TF-B3 domain-containing protein n=1 Tax=Stephania cephalantha TaxID=152367 RepID=A0AAP0NTT9_9MAGN